MCDTMSCKPSVLCCTNGQINNYSKCVLGAIYNNHTHQGLRVGLSQPKKPIKTSRLPLKNRASVAFSLPNPKDTIKKKNVVDHCCFCLTLRRSLYLSHILFSAQWNYSFHMSQLVCKLGWECRVGCSTAPLEHRGLKGPCLRVQQQQLDVPGA